MNVPKDAMLLRILFGEEDRFEGYPLYEAIVRKARENARCWSDGLSRADGLRSLQPVAALALRSKGLAIRQIAREVGLGVGTVRLVGKEAEVRRA